MRDERINFKKTGMMMILLRIDFTYGRVFSGQSLMNYDSTI